MTGWCFGTFFHVLGIIIPTDFHILQRGRYTTTNNHWPMFFESQVGLHVRRGDKLRMMPGLEEATSPENVLTFLRPGVSRPKGW